MNVNKIKYLFTDDDYDETVKSYGEIYSICVDLEFERLAFNAENWLRGSYCEEFDEFCDVNWAAYLEENGYKPEDDGSDEWANVFGKYYYGDAEDYDEEIDDEDEPEYKEPSDDDYKRLANELATNYVGRYDSIDWLRVVDTIAFNNKRIRYDFSEFPADEQKAFDYAVRLIERDESDAADDNLFFDGGEFYWEHNRRNDYDVCVLRIDDANAESGLYVDRIFAAAKEFLRSVAEDCKDN